MTTIYSEISHNVWKTRLIMVLFIVFLSTVAYVFGRAYGGNSASALGFGGIALIISGIMTIGSYYFSDQLVIASTGAQQIEKEDDPELFRIVENLTLASGMPMPKVYIMEDQAPNAFATGRDPKHAAVCVTTGILAIMNKSELEGVLAHELSHVKNYDTRLMGVVAILVGSIALLADMFMRSLWFRGRDDERENNGNQIFLILGIVFAILSPIIATLIQLSISRKREYLADASGALLTRYPDGLASALEKLEANHTPTRKATNATAHLFIENPFDGKTSGAWFASLFNTHPPIEDRIKILRAM